MPRVHVDFLSGLNNGKSLYRFILWLYITRITMTQAKLKLNVKYRFN